MLFLTPARRTKPHALGSVTCLQQLFVLSVLNHKLKEPAETTFLTTY